jgi:hypothetical protein
MVKVLATKDVRSYICVFSSFIPRRSGSVAQTVLQGGSFHNGQLTPNMPATTATSTITTATAKAT